MEQNNPICPKCQAPMKYSQNKQKWYCSQLCWKNAPQGNQGAYRGNPSASQEKQQRIDKAVERKEESIDTWASINNATVLLAEMLRGGDVFKNTKEITDKLKELAEGIRDVAQQMKRESVFKGDPAPQGYERQSEVIDAEQEANEQLSQIQY